MQKLLTVYLDNTAYGKPKDPMSYAEQHGRIEEHLQEYLAEGWHVRSLFALGGSSGSVVNGWLAVVLEKVAE